jgi:hypothetical protein
MLAAALIAGPALAGPPYGTDDPLPTDLGHWEIYAFGEGARTDGMFQGSTGLDINYGALPGVQLTATLPMDFVRGPGGRAGVGDVELAVKYQVLRCQQGSFSIAAFPRVILPTSGSRFGSGRVGLLLPLWAQRDIGKWSIFGGGGYAINPGASNRNYWQQGIAVTRQMTERLSLGVEATHHARDANDGVATTTLGVGGIWKIKAPLSLLASGGPSFSGGKGDRYHAYVALLFNF